MTDDFETRVYRLADRYVELEMPVIADERAKLALQSAHDTFCDDFHDDPFSYLNRDESTPESELDTMTDIDLALLTAGNISYFWHQNCNDPDFPEED